MNRSRFLKMCFGFLIAPFVIKEDWITSVPIQGNVANLFFVKEVEFSGEWFQLFCLENVTLEIEDNIKSET